jgi:hypothetical protein
MKVILTRGDQQTTILQARCSLRGSFRTTWPRQMPDQLGLPRVAQALGGRGWFAPQEVEHFADVVPLLGGVAHS